MQTHPEYPDFSYKEYTIYKLGRRACLQDVIDKIKELDCENWYKNQSLMTDAILDALKEIERE